MTGVNEVIHQQHRLRIVAALERATEPLDFSMLKAVSATTDGNLGAHIHTLQGAGYINVKKEAIGRRTRTWVSLTTAGRRAFREHVAFLEDILAASKPEHEANRSTQS